MTVILAGIEFDGPYDNPPGSIVGGGLFVVLKPIDEQFELVNFGYCDEFQSTLIDSENSNVWSKNYPESVIVALLPLPYSNKLVASALTDAIEEQFRRLDPPQFPWKKFS